VKSSSGQYFIALDHLRALAAFMVFAWHFTRGAPYMRGPINPSYTPDFFPFAFFDEGHIGVALFMVLSGFLFARLLDDKRVAWGAFYYNRLARLLPLFVVALVANLAMYMWQDWMTASEFLATLGKGFVLPTWPGGAWSIGVEWHFYLLLPPLLWLISKGSPAALFGVIVTGIAIRASFADHAAWLGYWTIIGRIDQFAAGMLAWHYRHLFTGNHHRAAAWMAVFTFMLWKYDQFGGLKRDIAGALPDAVSILMPTALGAGFAVLVAWYAGSFKHSPGPISTAIARAGEYSYSLYLLHVLFVFDLQLWLTDVIPGMRSFPVALIVALACFVAFVPIAGLSYRYIELPFLRRRKSYVLVGPGEAAPAAA
jgi:peptidoglycan/LPS O-acetylase OafA/YrhL